MNQAPSQSALRTQPGLRPPMSVALVGASRLEGGSYYGGRLLDNVLNAGPKARIYAVNPRLKGETVRGLTVYATLSELPEVPELVAITSPVPTVLPVLEEAERLGVGSSVIISAEHGEAAAQRAFDEAVAAVARRSGMRIIGPNSMGVFNAQTGLIASFSSATHGMQLPPGPVAVVAQSGAVISYLLQTFRGRSLGYSWLISSGNEAGLKLEDLLDELIADPDTGVILLFVEGIADGSRLRRAALKARAAGKAVVMMNVGVSEEGRDAVQSHTGRIAGTREMVAALAEEADIHRVHGYEELFDATRGIVEQGLPRARQPHGRRAAVLTTSGGAGSVAADQLSTLGWTLPPLPAETAAALAAVARQMHAGNPVDVTGAFADKPLLARMLRILAESGAYDALFLVSGAGGKLAVGIAEEIVAAAPQFEPETYVAWIGLQPEVAAVYEGSAVSAFPDSMRAIKAASASAAYRYGQARAKRSGELLALMDAPRRTVPVTREGLWTAAETLADLAASGVPCAGFAVTAAMDPAEAAAKAEAVGLPAVLKIDAGSLNHKSDSGGIRLRLADAAAVRRAAGELGEIAAGMGIGDGRLLVQSMTAGIEVLVGIKQDAAFGPLLVLGLGGTHAELHAETAVSTLLPTDRAGLRELLARHAKLNLLLDGYRGQAPGNREALVDTLQAIADWAVAKGAALREADFNPVMAGPEKALVVDARAVTDLGRAGERG